jgi:septation ring formation regulator EzrA
MEEQEEQVMSAIPQPQFTGVSSPKKHASRESIGNKAQAPRDERTERLHKSLIFRRRVMDEVASAEAQGLSGDNHPIYEKLRRDWPGCTESLIDDIIREEALAFRAAMYAYQASIEYAMKAGKQAEADTRNELTEE